VAEGRVEAGARFGGYVIERQIGEGGMARVYAAYHEFLGTRVALKILHPQFRARADIVTKMRAEAQLLSRLQHPNIVRVSDAGMNDDGTVWMAMELLVGETLRTELERSPRLPIERVLKYIGEAVAGLGAAHGQGVIHRDVKPENLFISDRGDVRVLDFGTAKFREHKTMHGTERFATIAYAAPEQLTSGTVDGRTDMYALGIVMHEALTGRHYLRAPDGTFPPIADLVMLQVSKEPQVDTLSGSVAALLRRATAKRPEERYANMGELADALRKLPAQLGIANPLDEAGTAEVETTKMVPRGKRGLRVSTTLALASVVAMFSTGATVLAEGRARGEHKADVHAEPAPVAETPSVTNAVTPRTEGSIATQSGPPTSSALASESPTSAPSDTPAAIQSGTPNANSGPIVVGQPPPYTPMPPPPRRPPTTAPQGTGFIRF
jgi:eukaryotic-like serine/threonine-protein kinase